MFFPILPFAISHCLHHRKDCLCNTSNHFLLYALKLPGQRQLFSPPREPPSRRLFPSPRRIMLQLQHRRPITSGLRPPCTCAPVPMPPIPTTMWAPSLWHLTVPSLPAAMWKTPLIQLASAQNALHLPKRSAKGIMTSRRWFLPAHLPSLPAVISARHAGCADSLSGNSARRIFQSFWSKPMQPAQYRNTASPHWRNFSPIVLVQSSCTHNFQTTNCCASISLMGQVGQRFGPLHQKGKRIGKTVRDKIHAGISVTLQLTVRLRYPGSKHLLDKYLLLWHDKNTS